jgi:hypothetical protein
LFVNVSYPHWYDPAMAKRCSGRLVVVGFVEAWQYRICIRIRNPLEEHEDAPRVILASRVASPDLAVAVNVDVDVAGPDGLAAPRNTKYCSTRSGVALRDRPIRRSR